VELHYTRQLQMEPDDKTYTINLDEILDTTGDITINLNDTYGTTTTYWAGDSISDITISGVNDGTFTIDTNSEDTINIGDWNLSGNFGRIDPYEVEKMCKEYPALEKVWRNFKAVYDLVKQDWKGKQDGEDELPF